MFDVIYGWLLVSPEFHDSDDDERFQSHACHMAMKSVDGRCAAVDALKSVLALDFSTIAAK